jgi:hypothetical protein
MADRSRRKDAVGGSSSSGGSLSRRAKRIEADALSALAKDYPRRPNDVSIYQGTTITMAKGPSVRGTAGTRTRFLEEAL